MEGARGGRPAAPLGRHTRSADLASITLLPERWDRAQQNVLDVADATARELDAEAEAECAAVRAQAEAAEEKESEAVPSTPRQLIARIALGTR